MMQSLLDGKGLLLTILLTGAAALTGLAVRPVTGAERGSCQPTEENVEGPYYLFGAPFRERVAPPGASGGALMLSGRVTGPDCATPLAGAVVDIWQTDAEGKYDFSSEFRWRGRVRTDLEGRYRFETVLPGRYRTGRDFRPSHIHLKISHPDGRTLITQVYFENDPYLANDPFVRKSLVIPLNRERREGAEVWLGTFDIVLGPPERPRGR
jgi:catechol 1,2-dioxygenase